MENSPSGNSWFGWTGLPLNSPVMRRRFSRIRARSANSGAWKIFDDAVAVLLIVWRIYFNYFFGQIRQEKRHLTETNRKTLNIININEYVNLKL